MIKYWFDGFQFHSVYVKEWNGGNNLYDTHAECIKNYLETLYLKKDELNEEISRIHDLYNLLPLDGTRGLSDRKS